MSIGAIPENLYWLIGKGRTRPSEPMYGAQIIDPKSGIAIADGEGDTLDDAIAAALRAISWTATHTPPASCEYCGDGKRTGLPGNHCENCMDTGLQFPDIVGVAEQSGAGVPETSVRCGAPVAQWRAFYNVSYPKLWGIETSDPAAIKAGLEIVVAPCMPEHAAKDIARAWNEKSAAPTPAVSPHNGGTP